MSDLDKVEVEIAVALGGRSFSLAAFLRLGRGARFTLESLPEEAVEVRAGGRSIARGRLIRGRDAQLAVEFGALAMKPAVRDAERVAS